jgi:hypothetical protein
MTTISTLEESVAGQCPAADGEAGAFFRQAQQAYLAAEQAAGGPRNCRYRVAGRLVQLRFAGDSLFPAITPALEHLREPDTAAIPDLVVCIWDSASATAGMPVPWDWDALIAGGHMRGFGDTRYQTAYQADAGTLSLMETAAGSALFCVRDARHLPFYETASPLRTILAWWTRERGDQVVHAAASGYPDGGVLIVGKGGSGKSTTSLVCLAAGMLYAGDNNVVLTEHPYPVAHSLYNSATLEPHHSARFPQLLPGIRNGARLQTEKAMIFVAQMYPDQVTATLPIRAILLPRVVARPEARLIPTSPATALAALAPSSIFSLPGAGSGSFSLMARFVRRVPSYVLELGADFGSISAAVSGLLSRIDP